MAKINLLPWRQELRKQRKQEFLAINMAVALIALGILLFLHMLVSSQLSAQDERKAYIKSEIELLDKNIAEIEELQKRKDELLSRMKVIQDLQGRRPVIVRVFDEIVRATPDKLYLTALERKGDQFRIEGVAESNNQVATFLRNLNASAWFKNPVLDKVASTEDKAPAGKAAVKSDRPKNTFSLTVDLEAPEPAADANKQGTPGAANATKGASK